MHGSIFVVFNKYVNERFGANVWEEIAHTADQSSQKIYTSITSYPDEEMAKLIEALAAKKQVDTFDILKDYGDYLGGYLLKTYAPLIDPSWKALDLIEKTEHYIHGALKVQDPKVKPPFLVTERINDSTVIIHYTSKRRMCGLAEGIVHHIAKHYKEKVAISQSKCMLHGDPECTIVIKKVV